MNDHTPPRTRSARAAPLPDGVRSSRCSRRSASPRVARRLPRPRCPRSPPTCPRASRRASSQAAAHSRLLHPRYGRTVVRAVNEVEAALAELRNEARHRALLVARRAAAQETRDLRFAPVRVGAERLRRPAGCVACALARRVGASRRRARPGPGPPCGAPCSGRRVDGSGPRCSAAGRVVTF